MTDIQKRKHEHIDLALNSQSPKDSKIKAFYYEPATSFPGKTNIAPTLIAGKKVTAPFWISSMTGGTVKTGQMNKILAKAAKTIGAGIGLGSCRIALEDPKSIPMFDIRKELGDELPLFTNLGIAEVEKILRDKNVKSLTALNENLQADGLIIHINPLQELLQPEGSCHQLSPLETIKNLLNQVDFPLIVKEVGQGFGPESLKELLKLNLEAIELAGFGGTNFSTIENKRSGTNHPSLEALTSVGHSADEMITWINEASEINCKNIIVSGGIKNALEGRYFNSLCKLPTLYGIASRLLEPTCSSLEDLIEYLTIELKSYKIAADFLIQRN